MLSKLVFRSKIYTSTPRKSYKCVLKMVLAMQTQKSKTHIVNNTLVKLCLADKLLTIDSAVLLIITSPVPQSLCLGSSRETGPTTDITSYWL